MQFTLLPPQHAPLGGEIRYAAACPQTATIGIRITDAQRGALFGAKRFAAVETAEFDVAPYLRPAVSFTPATGPTGVYPATDRTVTVLVEATAETDDTADGTSAAGTSAPQTATAPARTFLPSAESVTAPALLTAMPAVRLIPEGACDELTLLTDGPQTVTVTARSAQSVVAESYPVAGAGLHLFRVDLSDFPEAESLSVDAGACGTVTYSVIARPEGAVRLAWRSRTGSIEHYTFPVEATATVETQKQRACGPDGYVSSGVPEYRRVLRSAFETRAVLEALSEVTSSPEVWLAAQERYAPVEVTSERTIVHRHGAMSCLEIEIRSKCKTTQPWN